LDPELHNLELGTRTWNYSVKEDITWTKSYSVVRNAARSWWRAVSEAGEEFDCPKCNATQRVPVLESDANRPKRVTTRMSVVKMPDAPPATKIAKAVPPAHKKTIIVPRKDSEPYEEEMIDSVGGTA
jgi:hypothetical protein